MMSGLEDLDRHLNFTNLNCIFPAQLLRLRRARAEAYVDEGRGEERAQSLPLPLPPVEGFQCSRTRSWDAEVG